MDGQRERDGADKWLGTTLLYHSSAAMEVSGIFEFDAARRVGRQIEQGGAHTFDNDMSSDGSVRAYVDDLGLGPTFEERLHLVDTATGTDTVRVSKRSVMAPAISPANDAVAFVEVSGERATARDRVWIYRQRDGSVTMIDDDAVRPKSAGSGLLWSPDRRYLLINFGSGITVLDVTAATPPRKFRGTDACWSDADTIVFGNSVGVDKIDISSGTRKPIVSKGTRPQCVDAPTRPGLSGWTGQRLDRR